MFKTSILSVFFAILLSVLSINVYAHDIEAKNADGVTIYYNIKNETELEVTYYGNSYSSSSYPRSIIVIPEKVEHSNVTREVTSIGPHAFYYCGLTSVKIPNSVTSIGGGAFYGCFHLNTITCLGETPPMCNGSIFKFNGARDEYDVYNYAVLHVPMGSGELYASSYDWWYFKKIKEDMEMDGKIYYANLTVKQGTTGYTRQAVKASEKYTLFIGSLNDNKVNAVSFNGVDVTDDVVDGYYTTPEVKSESVLSISYETSANAITSPKLPNVRVLGHNGEIQITNIDEPSDIQVYSCDGKLISSRTAVFGSAQITVPTDQLYVVKVMNRIFKIAM